MRGDNLVHFCSVPEIPFFVCFFKEDCKVKQYLHLLGK